MNSDADRLTRLGELDGYKIADGDPDPRGWEMVTRDGDRIGRVDDLIVDREAERARYLDVRLAEGGETERHVLVPTDAVHIGDEERDRHQVVVAASMAYLAGVTPYTGLPLSTRQEAEYQACPPARAETAEPVETRIRRGEVGHD